MVRRRAFLLPIALVPGRVPCVSRLSPEARPTDASARRHSPDLLRLDRVTGRVEIGVPFCGREPSYNSESLRRQISFLFDESGQPAQGRNDPVLQDAAWALNWGGNSRAATAA